MFVAIDTMFVAIDTDPNAINAIYGIGNTAEEALADAINAWPTFADGGLETFLATPALIAQVRAGNPQSWGVKNVTICDREDSFLRVRRIASDQRRGRGDRTVNTHRAIIRHHDTWIGVLCPIGHCITTIETGPGSFYAGSRAEAELGAHSHGLWNVYDRLAAQCTGSGH